MALVSGDIAPKCLSVDTCWHQLAPSGTHDLFCLIKRIYNYTTKLYYYYCYYLIIIFIYFRYYYYYHHYYYYYYGSHLCILWCQEASYCRLAASYSSCNFSTSSEVRSILSCQVVAISVPGLPSSSANWCGTGDSTIPPLHHQATLYQLISEWISSSELAASSSFLGSLESFWIWNARQLWPASLPKERRRTPNKAKLCWNIECWGSLCHRLKIVKRLPLAEYCTTSNNVKPHASRNAIPQLPSGVDIFLFILLGIAGWLFSLLTFLYLSVCLGRGRWS